MRTRSLVVPRSRETIERAFAKLEREHGDQVRRHNFLVQRIDEDRAERDGLAASLGPALNEQHDLDWELFRRLQLDGVVPSVPQLADAQYTNYQEDDEDGYVAAEFSADHPEHDSRCTETYCVEFDPKVQPKDRVER